MAHIRVNGNIFEITLFSAASAETIGLLKAGEVKGVASKDGWSGPCVNVDIQRDDLVDIEFLEQASVSIYPGVIALRPAKLTLSAYHAPLSERGIVSDWATLMLSHGYAESRHASGKKYVTPFAKLADTSGEEIDRFETALSAAVVDGSEIVVELGE